MIPRNNCQFQGNFVVTNFDHLLLLASPENLSQIWVGCIFGWFWGVSIPPHFLPKKIIFGSGGVNIFVTNFDHLLVLAYSETLGQIRVGWVFDWFGGISTSPPTFCQIIEFWLWWGKIFCHQLRSFIGFSLPRKFEPNPSWLSFWLVLGGFHPPPLFAKIWILAQVG